MSGSMEFLRSVNAVVDDDHFVFKAGYAHGTLYIDKEEFSYLGANWLIKLLYDMVALAVKNGLQFGNAKKIGVVGPAYGAIPYALTTAGFLEEFFPGIKFFPARTQLVKVGKREEHYLPEKLIKRYFEQTFIGVEDIVNNGKTVRDLKKLFRVQANADVRNFLSLTNRGVQTAETLGMKGFYPLLDPTLDQYDIREKPCPMCAAGIPINTVLGKGAEWVAMFGQPPYLEGTDFSAFWKEE